MANNYDNFSKWKYSFYSLIAFYCVINPYSYKLLDTIFEKNIKILNKSGIPTFSGIILSGIIFMLIIRTLMDMNI
jgi:hypothetical protein